MNAVKNPTVTLRLAQTQQEADRGERSLDDLLREALRILNMDECTARQRSWIARKAVRAVCEAIIESRSMPIPLKVSWHDPYRVNFFHLIN